MSSKYKVGDDAIPHFVTLSVVGWIDVFSREQYKDLFVNSLKYCQDNKGLILHAWIIMTNHVHLIISSNENKLEYIVRDLKKYTSKQSSKRYRRIIWRAGRSGCSTYLDILAKIITTTKSFSR